MIDETYKIIRDENDNLVYYENATGWWWKKEFDSNGNCIYHGDATGFWVRHTYDSDNNIISYENFLGVKR